MKKTQRLADYPVLGRLALWHLADRGVAAGQPDYRWALDNVFTVPEFTEMLRRFPETGSCCRDSPALGAFVAQLATHGEATPDTIEVVEDWFVQLIRLHQRRDRLYWREIIAELRELRQSQQLMPEGTPVRSAG